MVKRIQKIISFVLVISLLTSCNATLTSNGTKIKNICQKQVFQEYIGKNKIKHIIKTYINTPAIKEKLKEANITIDKKNFSSDNATYNWIAEVFKAYIKKSIDQRYINTYTLSTINRQLFNIGQPQIVFGIPQDTSQLTEEQLNTITEAFLILGEHYLDKEFLAKMGINLDNQESMKELETHICELID